MVLEGNEDLHSRYILTNLGGIRIEHGLDEGQEGETTDVSLLDHLAVLKALDGISSGVASPYEYVDEVRVIGNLTQEGVICQEVMLTLHW